VRALSLNPLALAFLGNQVCAVNVDKNCDPHSAGYLKCLVPNFSTMTMCSIICQAQCAYVLL
jgi:hypothetical protein